MILTISFLLFYISFYIFERFKFGNFKYIKLNESFKSFMNSCFLTSIILIFFYLYPMDIFNIKINSSKFIESNIVYYISLFLFIFTLFKILFMYKYYFNIKILDNNEYLKKIQLNIFKSLYSFSTKTKIIKNNKSLLTTNYILYSNNNLEIIMTSLESEKNFFHFDFDIPSFSQKITVEDIIKYYEIEVRVNGYLNFILVKNIKTSKFSLLTKKDLQLMEIEDLIELSPEKLSLLEMLKM